MTNLQMGTAESRFADIIWSHEPLSSSDLARLSGAELGWKKTTSYTVLKRLCEKGIFQNCKGTVTSLISREEYYSMQSEQFVEEKFGGSLPAFIAAFTARKRLDSREVEELRRMVEEYKEES